MNKQVPYMITGGIIASVGSGLLTTISPATPAAQWSAYLVLTGIGVGMASQLPYTALQVVLEYAVPSLFVLPAALTLYETLVRPILPQEMVSTSSCALHIANKDAENILQPLLFSHRSLGGQ